MSKKLPRVAKRDGAMQGRQKTTDAPTIDWGRQLERLQNLLEGIPVDERRDPLREDGIVASG